MEALFRLLLAVVLLIFVLGCGEDSEPYPGPPRVVSVSIDEGQQIPGNAVIVLTFNKAVESVQITVSGATGTTNVAGKTATWAPVGDIPPGQHTLTVSCVDDRGVELAGLTSIHFVSMGPP